MRTFGRQAAYVVTHPGAFTLRVLRAFRANQGLLLAGAVAYYTLLSIVPLLILMVIALSQIIDQGELLATLGRYLEWLIPGQSKAVIGELASFLDHRGVIGWVLLVTMVFFSSLAFTVLENAMSVIFLHRVAIRRRHFLVSAVIPYCYIVFLGLGLLLMTLVSGSLRAVGAESIDFLGLSWSLRGVSGVLLYLSGVMGEIFVLTFFFQAEDGIRDVAVTGVQTCALPISTTRPGFAGRRRRSRPPRRSAVAESHIHGARSATRRSRGTTYAPSVRPGPEDCPQDRKSVV